MKIALLLFLLGGLAQAAIKPHGLFTDGAVLQQGIEVPVWGTAADGEKVTVKFQGQEVSTVTQNGSWIVRLKPLKPGGPFTMTIAGVEVKDVLVGEVWVCSGQSNMHFPLKQASTGPAALTNCQDRQLRLCSVPEVGSAEPLRDVNVRWNECTASNAASFSAIAYFFGRDLRKTLNVPVGLIHTSVGGTGVQFWMSWNAIKANPAFHDVVEAGKRNEANYLAALAKYQQQGNTNTPPPKRTERTMGKLYDGMIAPLQPFPIRGVIWFQGEANSTAASAYPRMFLEMVRGWRADWGIGDFPFLVGQLGPFVTPEIREAQLVCWQKSTNTAMIVSVDCSEGAKEVHFPKKEPVGVRLALAARAVAYGEKVEYSGPIYDSLKIEGDRAILSFKHTGAGLEARDALKGFVIAGADKKFVAATAKLEGDRVVVSSPEVAEPVAVRYGWATAPELSLYNKNGLPASPFRTDIR